MCIKGLLYQYFFLSCANFKILGGFLKWCIRNKTAEKGLKCDFQVVGSLLYAHFPIFFFILFE